MKAVTQNINVIPSDGLFEAQTVGKVCRKCGVLKSEDGYRHQIRHGKTYIHGICKACDQAYKNNWKKSDVGKALEKTYAKSYYQKNSEKLSEAQKQRRVQFKPLTAAIQTVRELEHRLLIEKRKVEKLKLKFFKPVCSCCGTAKRRVDFYLRNDTKSGITSRCAECTRKIVNGDTQSAKDSYLNKLMKKRGFDIYNTENYDELTQLLKQILKINRYVKKNSNTSKHSSGTEI